MPWRCHGPWRCSMEQQATPRPPGSAVPRRTVLKAGGALAAAAAAMNLLDAVAWRPLRSAAEAATLPDIQFDIGAFIAPARMINGVQFQFGPVYTTFATATLSRLPTKAEQAALANALNTIEAAYPF